MIVSPDWTIRSRPLGGNGDRRDDQDHAGHDHVVGRLDVVGLGDELPRDADAIADPAQEVARLNLVRTADARIDRGIGRRGDLDGRSRRRRRRRKGHRRERERGSRAAVGYPAGARREYSDEQRASQHDGREGERK